MNTHERCAPRGITRNRISHDKCNRRFDVLAAIDRCLFKAEHAKYAPSCGQHRGSDPSNTRMASSFHHLKWRGSLLRRSFLFSEVKTPFPWALLLCFESSPADASRKTP